MRKNLDFCLQATGVAESSEWSDDTQDPGNWTGAGINCGEFIGSKYGVSAATLCAYLGRPATQDDMKELQYAEYVTLATKMYWDTINGDNLFSGLDYMVFDFGYNTSPAHSARMLQRLVRVSDDGIIGSGTLKAINNVKPSLIALCNPVVTRIAANYLECSSAKLLSVITGKQALLAALSSYQYAYYLDLNNPRYQNGWLSRDTDRLLKSLQLESE